MKRTTKRADQCGGCKAAKVGAIFVAVALATIGIFCNTFILKSARSELRESFDYELRTAVETITGGMNAIYDRYQAGDLNEADAKNLALTIVRETAWNDGRRGFWVLERDGTLLVEDTRDGAIDLDVSVGGNVWNLTDTNGRYFQQDLIAAANNGGGFVEYTLNGDNSLDYISYAMPTEFGFVVTAAYDLNYFNQNAYPETRLALWWSVILLIGTSFVAIGCYAFALVHEK